MEKSIIEKLGIKPIKWKKEIVNCHKCGQAHEMSTFTNGDVTDIEAMRNEMLEALIEIYKATYSNRTSNPAKMLAYQKVKDAIEKATGKTWAEIEELKE